MSTTFDVYPGTPTIPTFAEVLDRATGKLNTYLESIQVPTRVELEVELSDNTTHALDVIDAQRAARWSPNQYAWFYVPTVPGGTDAYFREFHEMQSSSRKLYLSVREQELQRRNLDPLDKQRMEACLGIGHYWSFL